MAEESLPVEPSTKASVRAGYDALGEDYRRWSDAGGSRTRSWFLDEVLSRVPLGASVLELGCGSGVDAVRLAEGRAYTAVDISPVMVELTRRAVPGGTVLEADLMEAVFEPAFFDAVVALYVFGHLPADEHVPAITRVHTWLRPGGVLAASFPVGVGDGTDMFIGRPMFFGGIGRAATEGALRAAGFAIEVDEVLDDTNADGETETFHWVIARKP